MSEMQNKILAAMRDAVTLAGLEATSKTIYANTGTLYAQQGFDTLWEVRYGFHDDNCSLTFRGPRVVEVNEHTDVTSAYDAKAGRLTVHFHALAYNDGERIRKMLNLVAVLSKGVFVEPAAAQPDGSSLDAAHSASALSYGMFAINTYLEPQGSSDEDLANLDRNGEFAVSRLADLRDRFRESLPPIFINAEGGDTWTRVVNSLAWLNADVHTVVGEVIRAQIQGVHPNSDGGTDLHYLTLDEDYEPVPDLAAGWLPLDSIAYFQFH